MSSDANDNFQSAARKAADLSRADGPDLVRSAFDYVRGVPPAGGGSSGTPSIARQKESFREWARSLGLLLKADQFIPRLTRGGQDHDIFGEAGRVFKVTLDGMFGFSPGIELALVSSHEDARRFHLWEATPLEYLERLLLQNQLIPGLNWLEGIIDQGDDLPVVTSQPRFEIVPVTQLEIDAWFAAQGFAKITNCG